MKASVAPLSLCLLCSFLLIASPLVQADSVFSYIHGKQWKGVKIGGKAPRTLDTICKDRQCYRVKTTRSLHSQIMHKYNLDDIHFDQLAAAPGVQQKGDTLILPADLGYEIHRLAWWEYLRERRHRD